MTAFWRYTVRCYEHLYMEPIREGRSRHYPLTWFWKMCWFLHGYGFLRGAEGGYWRDAEWHWRFWDDIVIETPYRRFVIPYSQWRRSAA